MRRLFLGLAVVGLTALAPSGLMANDQELAKQIAHNLKTSGQLKGYSISIKVHEGTAWLSGTVKSDEQLAAALIIAQRTPGVHQIVSDLAVTGGSPGLNVPPVPRQLRQPGAAAPMASNPSSAGRPTSHSLHAPQRDSSALPQLRQSAYAPSVGENDDAGAAKLASNAAAELDAPVLPAARTALAAPTTRTRPNEQATRTAAGRGAPPLGVPTRPQRNPHLPPAAVASAQPMPMHGRPGGENVPAGTPVPSYIPPVNAAVAPVRYDHPHMPNYAWPSYAAYPNYAAVTYPKQYSPTAWPFIGPFYPYPQVPLGWRKVTLEWDDGWWMLDFKD